MYGEWGANLKCSTSESGRDGLHGEGGTKIKLPQTAPIPVLTARRCCFNLKNAARGRIPTPPKNSSASFKDNGIFKEVCAFDNQSVTAPEIQYDKETALPVNVEAQEKWNKAAINAGWAIVEYLKSSTVKNQWQSAQSECEAIGSIPGLSH